MSTLKSCFLSAARIDAATENRIKGDADLTLLVTGICAIGRGDVKLCHVAAESVSSGSVSASLTYLIFSTTEGFPLLKVQIRNNHIPDLKLPRIEVFCGYTSNASLSVGVVASNDTRYILRQLGAVRQLHTVRERRRKRDIQNIGLSMAELIKRVRHMYARDAISQFVWSGNQEPFEVKIPSALSSSRMDDKTLWSLLQVFTGEKQATEISDPSIQQDILLKYRQINDILSSSREKWAAFREFWSNPKIIVGLLPRDRGLVVSIHSFKGVADEAVNCVENWDMPRPPYGPENPLTFKYYDCLSDIEEPLLTQVMSKCAFVRMFGGNQFPWVDQYPKTDKDGVLPISKTDNIWKDINFLSYATHNCDTNHVNWFVMDYDGE